MSLRKNLQGLVAAFAVAGGLASSASAADSIVCTAGNCTCKFDWGTPNKDCKPASGVQNKRANKAKGVTISANNYTSFVSLVTGSSSSAIPITSSGQLFPEACRATDQVKDDIAAFKGCQNTALGVPSHVRVLVGP